MIVEVRVYESHLALMEQADPIRSFSINHDRHDDRVRLAKCAKWCYHNGHCLVTWKQDE